MPEQLPQTLQVGYAGDVVLTGGRLWRSTEVTLGSQKADRITVLPNMEGIIASFTCVRPQGGWQGLGRTPPQPAVVRVWTSEGVTSLEGEWVTLEYPGTARARGAKPCEDEGAPEKARPRP